MSVKKFILYSHDGSGNHGCEALVRTTLELLNRNPEEIVIVSERPEEDIHYGINRFGYIFKRGQGIGVNRKSLEFLKAYWHLKVHRDYWPIAAHCFLNAVDAHNGDVAISIGGDTYCYGGTDRLAREHAMWKSRRLKTVYWGCSIEPELLKDKAIAKDIASYDLITARETISYEALKRVNPNTILVSDSAFLLKKKDVVLPSGYENYDLVGINSSPLIESSEAVEGLARENYCTLIDDILANTDMKILLIPHVVWATSDDRCVLNELYEKYKGTDRVYLVQDCNCEELKGYISRCRFFIGARTHATIAAYSTCVPTLVLGYSVKSKGIARDLFGTEENYVIPVQSLAQAEELTQAFRWIVEHEKQIRSTLGNAIPEYSNRVLSGVAALEKL